MRIDVRVRDERRKVFASEVWVKLEMKFEDSADGVGTGSGATVGWWYECRVVSFKPSSLVFTVKESDDVGAKLEIVFVNRLFVFKIAKNGEKLVVVVGKHELGEGFRC
jgi:hypothetical protein